MLKPLQTNVYKSSKQQQKPTTRLEKRYTLPLGKKGKQSRERNRKEKARLPARDLSRLAVGGGEVE